MWFHAERAEPCFEQLVYLTIGNSVADLVGMLGMLYQRDGALAASQEASTVLVEEEDQPEASERSTSMVAKEIASS